MKRMREWLDAIGLGVHAELFEREQIDLDAATHLTEQHLKELGLPIGHRVKFLAALSAYFGEPIGSSTPRRESQVASPPDVKEQGERR